MARRNENEVESCLGCLFWALLAWGLFVYHVIMPPVSEALGVSEGWPLFFLIFVGVPVLLFVFRYTGVRRFFGW